MVHDARSVDDIEGRTALGRDLIARGITEPDLLLTTTMERTGPLARICAGKPT